MLVQNNMISFLALFAQAVWATDLDHGPSHPNYPLAIFVEKNYIFILRRFPNIFTGYLSFKGSDPTGTHLLRFPPLSPSHPSLINSKDVQSIKVNNLKKFRSLTLHVFKPPPRSPGHQEKKHTQKTQTSSSSSSSSTCLGSIRCGVWVCLLHGNEQLLWQMFHESWILRSLGVLLQNTPDWKNWKIMVLHFYYASWRSNLLHLAWLPKWYLEYDSFCSIFSVEFSATKCIKRLRIRSICTLDHVQSTTTKSHGIHLLFFFSLQKGQ